MLTIYVMNFKAWVYSHGITHPYCVTPVIKFILSNLYGRKLKKIYGIFNAQMPLWIRTNAFRFKKHPVTYLAYDSNASKELIEKICFAYLNGIVVFGSTIWKHNKNLTTLRTPSKNRPQTSTCQIWKKHVVFSQFWYIQIFPKNLWRNIHPFCYILRTLNAAEFNYTMVEKELLAIVWAVNRLRQYLLGRKDVLIMILIGNALSSHTVKWTGRKESL